jgi:hypothetical protein
VTWLDPGEAWVQRAVDAAADQLGHVAVEDVEVLDVIAEAIARSQEANHDAA